MLRCDHCGGVEAASKDVWRCPRCDGPWLWDGERALNRGDVRAELHGLWRYQAALPLGFGDAVSLGETMTPLLPITSGGSPAWAKLDYLLPSGSYKDRGAAVMISALRMLGTSHLIEDSSGNAGAAVAAYAARGGLGCTVFAPAAASAGKLVQAAAFGADVRRVAGSRDDVADAAVAAAATMDGASYASHNWHPLFIEGVKTWAFEVWEQLGFRAPDAIVAPVGSGSMILGAHLAFGELRRGGAIDRLPRLYAAQPAACAPLVHAFAAGGDEVARVERGPTLAEGASIARPVRGRHLLRALRESSGGAVAISEAAIVEARLASVQQELYIEPTSAVAVAGAAALRASGDLGPDDECVVMMSGSGLKATEAIQSLLR
ncbi:MAG: pyridoxal-phosphate dependent enzyme [Thermomicrobiales bacterium]